MCVIQFRLCRTTISLRRKASDWCNILAHGLQTACVYIWDILRCVCVCVWGCLRAQGGVIQADGLSLLSHLLQSGCQIISHTHTLLNGGVCDSHSSSMCTDLILYSALEYVRNGACGYLSLSKGHETFISQGSHGFLS